MDRTPPPTSGSQPASLEKARETIATLRVRLAEERHRRERIENNERCFRELAEHIQEVFWMTNPLGDSLVYISPAYEHIWGQSCKSLYEDPGRRLAWVYEADRERVLKAFKRDARNGDFDETYRIDRPDGQIRWIRDRAFPVYDRQGDLYRLAGFALDITDGVRANDRISRLQTTIGARDRISVFAALGTGLAHDISQPLTAARTFIADARYTAAQSGCANSASLDRAVEEIERAVKAIRHMRDFAREGNPTLSTEHIQPLLTELHELMDPALRASGIRYAGPTPEAMADITVALDPIFARQILRNLVSNAIGAFDDGAEKTEAQRHLEIGLQGGDAYVEIEIADNGSGIVEGVDPFAPFETSKNDGLGLGLAVSRSLARSQGGDLFLTSRGRAGGGDDRTRFVLRLPRAV